jgi:hypothetical protein
MKKTSKLKTINVKPSLDEGGLASLYHHIEYEKKAAKKIFQLVTEERGSDTEVQALATKGVLRELIFLMIDLTKGSRAAANQIKSKEGARLAKAKAQKLLYDWLDINIKKFTGELEECSEVAALEIKALGRGESWVRRQITAYRKDRKLT